jgi:hypothetical protein
VEHPVKLIQEQAEKEQAEHQAQLIQKGIQEHRYDPGTGTTDPGTWKGCLILLIQEEFGMKKNK